MPRLGQKYALELETVSQSREAYQAEAYVASGLPTAPSVMVENEIAAQGPSLSEAGLEAVIRRHLGLAPRKHKNAKSERRRAACSKSDSF
jgi:hypothetical protein